MRNTSTFEMGGYDNMGNRAWNGDVSEIHTHKVSGSFHWELKINALEAGNLNFVPSLDKAMVDTGTT